MTAEEQTRWVINQAQALGFDLCGVAPVEDSAELQFLPEWLARGYGGEMDYLGDARRRSPERVLAGARSLIVCALNYNTPLPYSTEVPSHSVTEDSSGTSGWISRYAWGDDYHDVVRGKLEALLEALRNQLGQPFEARAYVDTGPVAERVAAKYAGLGWLAKNTCLIHPQLGSWLFLGVILTTLDLAPSLAAAEAPLPDLCGNCRLCIEACPTGAIVEPYVLDARRCISYLTIELRGTIPEELRPAMGRMVFGCDICQDVCPWNRQAPETTLAAFLPRPIASTNETRNLPRQRSEAGQMARLGSQRLRRPGKLRCAPGHDGPLPNRRVARTAGRISRRRHRRARPLGTRSAPVTLDSATRARTRCASAAELCSASCGVRIPPVSDTAYIHSD